MSIVDHVRHKARPSGEAAQTRTSEPWSMPDCQAMRAGGTVIAAASAAIALAACGSSAPASTTLASSPSPAASTLNPITAAAAQECSSYNGAYAQIQSDSDGDLTPAKSPDVPQGSNTANNVAVRIDRAALDADRLALYADKGATQLARIKPAWNKLRRDMNAIENACEHA